MRIIMNEIFKQFLEEEGFYILFCKALKNKNRESFSYYCKRTRIENYCVGLHDLEIVTNFEEKELTKRWIARWNTIKTEVLYKFIVENGVLFQFLDCLPGNKTLKYVVECNPIHMVFANSVKRESRDTMIMWNKLHRKWVEHVKEKFFSF